MNDDSDHYAVRVSASCRKSYESKTETGHGISISPLGIAGDPSVPNRCAIEQVSHFKSIHDIMREHDIDGDSQAFRCRAQNMACKLVDHLVA